MALEQRSIVRISGLTVGLLFGGVVGPIVFRASDLGFAGATTLGSLVGAALGYAVVSVFLFIDARRRDNELLSAARAVTKEAGLPETLKIRVKDAHIILEGEADNEAIARHAEEILATLPGIKGVSNRIRWRSMAGPAANQGFRY